MEATADAPARAMYATREAWLVAAIDYLRPRYEEIGAAIPARVRATCGWPSSGGKGRQRRCVGECWAPEASADRTSEVFVSPTLADPVLVLSVLVHELIHAAIGVRAGHGAEFRRCMRKLGLAGKATATKPADDFPATYARTLSRLGAYPHAAVTPAESGRKKDGTRMLKACCEGCGYTVRLSRKWAELGLPVCHCGRGPLTLDEPLDDSE